MLGKAGTGTRMNGIAPGILLEKAAECPDTTLVVTVVDAEASIDYVRTTRPTDLVIIARRLLQEFLDETEWAEPGTVDPDLRGRVGRALLELPGTDPDEAADQDDSK